MLREWRGATVDPGGDKPEPDSLEPVDLPGKPKGFADAEAVAYQTNFSDPRSGSDEHAVLRLEGVYAHARVWLNGSFLSEHDAYFEPFDVRLDAALQAENELVVECRRPDDRFGGSFESGDVPAEDSVPGIWWGAEIVTYDEHRIVDLSARPRLDDDGARFEVRTTVVAETDLEDRVTFSVKPEGDRRGRGMMNRAGVEASAGERTTVRHTIDVRDPTLWWPHDLGTQSRYVIRAKLGDRERTVTTGLCSVAYNREDGLRVNGQEVTARGVNLLAAEPADIERAVDLNANVVRTHAHVPAPEVYEAADDAGVLVWQDLPLTGPGPFDVERGRDLVARMVDANDHHPSLATIGVHDEPTTLGNGDLGSGFLDRLRLRWRMWRAEYDREGTDAVAANVPDWLSTIPVVGPPGIDPDATALSPGWEYGNADDIAWLLERYPSIGDIVAEYGAGSLGSDAEATDVAGFDREIHDRNVSGDRTASQAYQQEVITTITEALRLNGTDLLIAGPLRDLGGAGMGVLNDDGTEKPAAAGLRDAFEPVQAFLADPAPGADAELFVHNTLPSDVSGEVTWSAGDDSGTEEFSLEGNGVKAVGTIRISDASDSIELSVTTPERTATNRYQL